MGFTDFVQMVSSLGTLGAISYFCWFLIDDRKKLISDKNEIIHDFNESRKRAHEERNQITVQYAELVKSNAEIGARSEAALNNTTDVIRELTTIVRDIHNLSKASMDAVSESNKTYDRLEGLAREMIQTCARGEQAIVNNTHAFEEVKTIATEVRVQLGIQKAANTAMGVTGG